MTMAFIEILEFRPKPLQRRTPVASVEAMVYIYRVRISKAWMLKTIQIEDESGENRQRKKGRKAESGRRCVPICGPVETIDNKPDTAEYSTKIWCPHVVFLEKL